ncbi:hypothetical protein D3C72_1863080 [compost metagenome]
MERRLKWWAAGNSSVTPMPPCNCTACWPTKVAASPTRALAAETVRRRSAASALSALAAASMAIERACSRWMNMSAMRCCKAWNLPMGAPNCWRVFRYSRVAAKMASMAPTASAHSKAAP